MLMLVIEGWERDQRSDVSRSIIAVVRFGARARIGLEAVQMRVVLKLNYKKASQSDCDQVFGYGDENVFSVQFAHQASPDLVTSECSDHCAHSAQQSTYE